ncbi:MAG: hypothetical protein K6A38_09330 [Lachnospiraceae bacterium]|nr:hypothetical protein [Lachnospiraceae bacterium]
MKAIKFLNATTAFIMAAALIAVNIVLFAVLETYTTVFWISFAFSIIAFALALIFMIFDVGIGEKKQIYAYVLYPVVTLYLIAQIVVAATCSFLLKNAVFFSFLWQIVILVVFLVVYLCMRKANADVKQQQALRGQDIAIFKSILENAKLAAGKIDYSAPYRKDVLKAVDALASGQVRSTPVVAEIESKMLTEVGNLSRAVDENNEASIISASKAIERLAEERNRLISSSRAMF